MSTLPGLAVPKKQQQQMCGKLFTEVTDDDGGEERSLSNCKLEAAKAGEVNGKSILISARSCRLNTPLHPEAMETSDVFNSHSNFQLFNYPDCQKIGLDSFWN